MDSTAADAPPAADIRRNGVAHEPADAAPHRYTASRSRMGWFGSLLAHIETGLMIALPIAPVIATFLTVVLYIDPLQPFVWQQITASVPIVLMVPGNLLLVWFCLGLALSLLRLGSAARANPSSYAQLNTRLLGFETYRASKLPRQDGLQVEHSLDLQLDFVWRALEVSGPKWMLGDGFISLWRQVDRYSGLLRARNIMLEACTMTSIAVYALFWLGIVAMPAMATSQAILGAALFFTTVGALVGLFQVLYTESQAETGVDDYGLSLARIAVAPQLAGLAALLGVVLTSLATSTLSGSPASVNVTSTIPSALDQIRNPANVLVAVGFALSPGLVFSRFRQNVEQTKRELTRTAAATTSPQPKPDH
jgi:hypothetical protein